MGVLYGPTFRIESRDFCAVVAAHGNGLMVASPATPLDDVGDWRERAPPKRQQ